MASERIECPSCHAVLSVPPGYAGHAVRCGKCRHRFRPSSAPAVTEDLVASWLLDEPEQPSFEPDSAQPPAPSPEDPDQTMHPVTTGPMRIVKVDRKGVLLEFPVDRLSAPAFRCAMPRRCLKCGTEKHLCPHVIIYSAHMVDSISLEAEHLAGALTLTNSQVSQLSPEELLSQLPDVPNVPPPANRPMPYWLCDMCSSAGIISGQVEINSATGEGFCRLEIRNYRRAAEFLTAVGAAGTDGYDELVKLISESTENPWELVPLAVQHRLQQWFRPESDEHFLAYVPDRDRARTEDGMGGVLISSHRLIHHTDMRHHEIAVGKPLRLVVSTHGKDRRLAIDAKAWHVSNMAVDHDGLRLLRRALTLGGYQVTWQ